MTEYRRHLPPDASLPSLHVALNRLWEALEAQGGVTASATPARPLGASPSIVVSGAAPASTVTRHNALTGLQGGDVDNYYHLKSDEYIGTGTGVFVRKDSPTITGSVTLGTVIAGLWNGTKVGLVYGGTNADLSATGGASQVLRQSTPGGAISVSQLAFSDVSSTCATTQGGTGLTSYALGDMLYASAANVLSTLAGYTTAAMAVLTMTGTGTAAAAPVWTATTGTGNVVRATSPTLVTPTLGVASATSLAITGTAGAGFVTLVAQSVNPTAPAAGTLLLHASTVHGFTRMEQDNEATTNLIYGRDNVFIAKNTSGGTITKGSPVYVTGSTGNVPNIAKAKADSTTTLPAVGVMLDDILNNAFGQVMVVGIIANFDTSAFSVGASVWVSPTTAGSLTSTRPSGTTNNVQRVGTILVSGIGNGSMQIEIAPAILNMETGTNAATWTGRAIVGTSINKVAVTAPATSATLTIADGKTLTSSNTLTFSGADGSTLNIGTGGTLGTAAYTAATAYEPALGNPGTNGWVLSSTVSGVRSWIAPSAGTGTVTSVAALTLGTTGTDLSSTVATGTTTPVITLNVPTASATNRGALSAADWTTFNGKQAALGFTPINKAGDTGIGDLSMGALTATTVTFSGLLTANGGISATTGTFSSTVTAPSGVFSTSLSLPSAAGTAQFAAGNGDAASLSMCNIDLQVWNGFGLWNPTAGGAFPNQRSIYFDVRNGAAGFGGAVSMGALTATTGNFSSVVSTTDKYYSSLNASGYGSFVGNWNGSNLWALGQISNHGLRLGMVDIPTKAFMTAPGDMSLQIDGAVSMGALTATSVTVTGGGALICRSVISASVNTTAGSTAGIDYVYFMSGTTTLTLPTAVGNSNQYTIKNTGSTTVTMATTSSQTIDGSTTATLSPNTSLTVISDNSNWRIV